MLNPEATPPQRGPIRTMGTLLLVVTAYNALSWLDVDISPAYLRSEVHCNVTKGTTMPGPESTNW